jgi:hypothetical protein
MFEILKLKDYKLTFSELVQIKEWQKKFNFKNDEIYVIIFQTNGIGPTIKVAAKNQLLDLTDVSSW